MGFAAVPPIGECNDCSGNAAQSQSHNYTLRVLAAIGPKHLDGQGLQGRVLVAFSISETGQLQGVRLAQSSGFDELDHRALQIVGAANIPVPPSGLSVMRRSYISAFSFA